ncbi:hypothetical protein [Sphaerisporangium fuscum]|uniref:hypothetical protein n=1 Tax=Sphaerisporangium fuscum TaxID=2835868 RepID=UPI001BDC4932|nr:hypothetical protein [Sphaerisporangium fuscum]
MSKRLCRASGPALLDHARRLLTGDRDAAYRLLARTMVAHARSNVAVSELLDLQGVDHARLMPLRLLSFRSHFEGFIARVAEPERLREHFENAYRRLGEQVRDDIRLALVPTARTPEGPSGSWGRFVEATFGDLRQAFRNGVLESTGDSLENLDQGRDEPLSPTRFHSLLGRREALERLLYRSADFQAFRMESSVLYSLVHTLGLSVPERYLLCYVVARSNEDVAGCTASDLLRAFGELAEAFARSRDGAGMSYV